MSMLPKLLSLLGVLLQIGQFMMETYVQVRKILPPRKGKKLTKFERIRLNELLIPAYGLTPEEEFELMELQKRLRAEIP
jgi:hypothetical protein